MIEQKSDLHGVAAFACQKLNWKVPWTIFLAWFLKGAEYQRLSAPCTARIT